MVVFLNGSNCTARFQFCEYGTFELPPANPVSAMAGMPMLLRKTNPSGVVPSNWSSVLVVDCKGGLVDKRTGWPTSAVPVEAQGGAGQAAVTVVVRTVLTVVEPLKSGLGERLLPVIGACEMP